MSFRSLAWWHWWFAALVLGAAVGFERRWSNSDLSNIGIGLDSQASFERAVVAEINGRPLFYNLTVYASQVDDGDGGIRRVDIVRGLYCDGHPDPMDGKLHWRRTFFVAPIPYRPAIDFAELGIPSESAGPWQTRPAPTVRDFLDLLVRHGKVRYTNAWWDSFPFASSMGASSLALGLLCPLLANLLMYGRMLAPARPKGVSLWHIAGSTTSASSTPVQHELDAAQELCEELAEPSAALQTQPPPLAPSAPVRKLESEPVPFVEPEEREVQEFAAGATDYYPTARQKSRK